MAGLEVVEDVVREKIEEEGWTHSKLSSYLQTTYPDKKGFSVQCLARFCAAKNIHKTSRLRAPEVDTVVAGAIAKVK